MTTPRRSQNSKFTPDPVFEEKLTSLCNIGAEHLDDILDHFGIKYKKTSRYAYFACPIHGGDNPAGVNIYYDGYKMKGYWRCNTHHCQEKCGASLIGFIRGLLSEGPELVKKWEAIKWLEKYVGVKLDSISVDTNYLQKKKFIAQTQAIYKELPSQQSKKVSREYIQATLKIPPQYYLDQQFPKDLLVEYDVGLCEDPQKEMGNRIVFPVYDHESSFVGCVGRSVLEKCPKCDLYHQQDSLCPTNYLQRYYKWSNNSGFTKGKYLYNYHKAKPHIEKKGSVILVEGQADVLRLVQAGVYNSVGLFGTALTEDQEIILERSGALQVLLMLDNDQPGQDGSANIAARLNRFYKVKTVLYGADDPSNLTVAAIKQIKELY